MTKAAHVCSRRGEREVGETRAIDSLLHRSITLLIKSKSNTICPCISSNGSRAMRVDSSRHTIMSQQKMNKFINGTQRLDTLVCHWFSLTTTVDHSVVTVWRPTKMWAIVFCEFVRYIRKFLYGWPFWGKCMFAVAAARCPLTKLCEKQWTMQLLVSYDFELEPAINCTVVTIITPIPFHYCD